MGNCNCNGNQTTDPLVEVNYKKLAGASVLVFRDGPIPKADDDTTTVERPQPKKCACRATDTVYLAGSAARIRFTRGLQDQLAKAFNKKGIKVSLRIAVTLSSDSCCDLGTKGRCRYTYVAESVVEAQRLDRPNRGKWLQVPSNILQADIRNFAVGAPVNQSFPPDRKDRSVLSIEVWRRAAPEKRIGSVSLDLIVSGQGQGLGKLSNEPVMLCLPGDDPPRCEDRKDQDKKKQNKKRAEDAKRSKREAARM